MPDQDIDPLFLQLRRAAPSAPAGLSAEIIARLGPSAANIRILFLCGALSSLAAVLISAGISLETVHRNNTSAPPALALFSAGFGPISTR